MKLLLVEDHPSLAEAFQDGLSRAGFAVDHAGSIARARQFVERSADDLALLDLGLPEGSGLELLEEWRSAGTMPVIVLTARGGLGDRVDGLNKGADDYLAKPVEMPELVARCRAVLRRPGNRASRFLETGALQLNTAHREVRLRSEILPLCRREIGALEILMQRANHVVSRRAIEDAVYAEDADISLNAIDVAVSRLMRRLTWIARKFATDTDEAFASHVVERPEGPYRVYFAILADPANLIGCEILDRCATRRPGSGRSARGSPLTRSGTRIFRPRSRI